MSSTIWRTVHPLILLAIVAGPVRAAAPAAQPPRPDRVLATVNGAPITVRDFDEALAAFHAGVKEGGAAVPRQNPQALLDRLINAKLILQEARRIGVDELPEVKNLVDVYGRDTLRELLFRRETLAVAKPDPQDLEALYKNAVREVRLRAVLIPAEADAKTFDAAIKGGGDFDALARNLVAAGKAQAGDETRWNKPGELVAQVEPAVARLKVGGVSPLLQISGGFTMIKVLDERFPESADARRKAEQEALDRKRSAALRRYTESLLKQLVTVDEKLLKSLDFEAKTPGFEALRKDRRTLATVKGASPVTVADLADAIQKRFFHGVDMAIQSKKINAQKGSILDDLLLRRAVLTEAKRLRIDQSEEYKAALRDYEESVVFGAFVKKAVAPGVKVEEADLKKYVAGHAEDYRTPAMIQLDGVAFVRRADAEAALAKLRQGADLQWLRANAEGQADPATAKAQLDFPPAPVVTSTLPEGARKALSGASPGDYRFYGEREGPYYVLLVRSVIAARPQPFEAVKDEVAKKVFAEKLQQAVDDWAAKLRAASAIKILATPEQLNQLIGQGPKSGL